MRIGINTLFLVPGDVGGTEIYLRNNLKEMLAANGGISFVLFTTRDNEALFRSDFAEFSNVSYVKLPFKGANRPVRILAEQLLLPLYVLKSKVDMLWSPGYTAPIFCRCPQAVTVHDLQYKTHPEDLGFVERNILNFLVLSACRVCDAVIAVSEFSRKEILKAKFAEPEKVFAVLEGVDPVFATPCAPDDMPPEFLQKPFVLCVAHTYPHKNVHLLIDAFTQLATTIPHDLVLIGKARRGESRVEESLAKSDVRDRIHRLQMVEFEGLRALYQKADVFVLPSEYEGFGLPILEAMLSGTLVVTNKKASLPEVGGEYVVYVEKEADAEGLAQGISHCLACSPKVKAERIRSGREWAASFTWKKSAAQTLQVLMNIIKKT